MGEALWSEMLDDEVTDLTHELHLDVVAEANKEHAAAGTELRDTALYRDWERIKLKL